MNDINFAEYFSSDFDSINTQPNGKIYITKGPYYIRYSDKSGSKVDKGYPKTLVDNWGFGDQIGSFAESFDSMGTLPNDCTYVTKGAFYLRYSDPKALIIDEGYPRAIGDNWGDIHFSFIEGFDAMATLRNGKTYVFKGDSYYRYSDKNATKVDAGYPKKIAGNWGDNLPKSFESGIDCIAVLPNNKTYMFKGDEYVRYSDEWCNKVDKGYPLPIAGYWGQDTIK